MAGSQIPLILIPRFTTFAGPEIYRGLPLDVTAFSRLTLTIWSGFQPGTSPVVTMWLQGSFDRQKWDDITSPPWAVAPGAEIDVANDLTAPWVRYVLSVAGAGSMLTCWAQGFAILRER